jgi:hypothetical protein
MSVVNQGGVLDKSLARQHIEQMVGQQLGIKDFKKSAWVTTRICWFTTRSEFKEKQSVQRTGPAVEAYGMREATGGVQGTVA